MGILADAALEEGAPVYGVIPAGLAEKEIAHGGLTHLDIVTTMHERKARMSEVAAGFLTLAGGFGTLDEFFEIVTWRQLGHHSRPIVLFNGSGYFDPLLTALRHVADQGFARDGAEYFAVETEPDAAVRRALAGSNRKVPARCARPGPRARPPRVRPLPRAPPPGRARPPALGLRAVDVSTLFFLLIFF